MSRPSRVYRCNFCNQYFYSQEDVLQHECTRIRTPQHTGMRQPQADIFLRFRRYPFIGVENWYLTRDDRIAGQHIEFFEVDSSGTTDAFQHPLAQGTIGLRCIRCIGNTTGATRNASFPRGVAEIGNCLRDVAENHLYYCEGVPIEHRQILGDALNRRQRAKLEGGQAWSEQENDRQCLLEYSHRMAQELRLIDTYSGVVIKENAPAEAQHQPVQNTLQMATTQESFYQMPPNFPFVQERFDRWVCKYCQGIPEQNRSANYEWNETSIPPDYFVDYHLKFCQVLQESLLFSQQPNDAHQPPLQTQPAPVQAIVPQLNPGTPIQAIVPQFNPETPVNRAIDYLKRNDLSLIYEDGGLVDYDDKLLLTNYYFYLMKQLRPCKFIEKDRRNRGRKRDNIEENFGGLQCVHCASKPNARKFFWRNVDQLSNSFAEIKTHIEKCDSCPQEIKQALFVLKKAHKDEMKSIPRGSQKAYFRRMWKRIHDLESSYVQVDSETAFDAINSTPLGSANLSTSLDCPATQNSQEVVLIGEPTLLNTPNDQGVFNENEYFIRQQVEVFSATKEDVNAAVTENQFPIDIGTVGIRCVHCSKSGTAGNSTFYPLRISDIYGSVQQLHRLHLDACPNVPQGVRSKLTELKRSSSSSVDKRLYEESAKELGLVDKPLFGIRRAGVNQSDVVDSSES